MGTVKTVHVQGKARQLCVYVQLLFFPREKEELPQTCTCSFRLHTSRVLGLIICTVGIVAGEVSVWMCGVCDDQVFILYRAAGTCLCDITVPSNGE